MIEKLTIPSEVIDEDWRDDIGDYQEYDNEKEYISPTEIPEESIEKIKSVDLKPQLRIRGQKVSNALNEQELVT